MKSNLAQKDLPYAKESLLFLFILLFIAIPAHPFATHDMIKSHYAGSILTTLRNIFNLVLCFYYIYYVSEYKKEYLKVYSNPFTYLHIVFFVLNFYQADDMFLIVRNTFIMCLNLFMFSMLFIIPKDKKEFVDMIGLFACIILFLCYFGAIFIPSGAVHLESDGVDQGLVGAWRGIFTQKNAAGGFFAVCTFMGILCYNNNKKIMGAAIYVLAVLFIIMAKSKTALGFVFIVSIIGYFVVYTKYTLTSLAGLFAYFTFINFFTVGTIFFPEIPEFLKTQGIDITFTGRTPLWEFCLQGVEAKPLLGFGAHGFWAQPHIKHGGTAAEEWIHQMGSAHNAMLENVLHVGFIGSIFIICFAFFMPAYDIWKIQKNNKCKTKEEKSILYFLVCSWIFFWCAGTTESTFYVFFGTGWYLFVFYIFGFRHLATFNFK